MKVLGAIVTCAVSVPLELYGFICVHFCIRLPHCMMGKIVGDEHGSGCFQKKLFHLYVNISEYTQFLGQKHIISHTAR